MSIDLSLDRISKLLSFVRPYTRPTCHIAGTNGKGSVSALLSSILIASSYRVGRFNSPHLVSIYDCITIDNAPVSPDVYAEVRQRVVAADEEHALKSTSFELLTCTALVVLEEAKVDIAVAEVGMGGRLDATNVIPDECILVSALTAVDLDHQSFLGNTVSKIAREKASIARRWKPFVLGSQKYPEVNTVVFEVVKTIRSHLKPCIVAHTRAWDQDIDGAPSDVTCFHPGHWQQHPLQPVTADIPPFSEPMNALLPLQGKHQVANLGTALTMVSSLICFDEDSPLQFGEKITLQTISDGIRGVRWDGRLSFHTISLPSPSSAVGSPSSGVKTLVLADGAHNPASAITLSTYLNTLLAASCPHQPPSSRGKTLTFILGLSHSPPKTPTQTLTPLLDLRSPDDVPLRVRVALVRFTTPDGMPWIKSENPSDLRKVVSSLRPDAEIWTTEDEQGAEGQMAEALTWAGGQHDEESLDEHLVVVAGSLYLVADFYRFLQAQR